jgi:pilus assembly protein CpaE
MSNPPMVETDATSGFGAASHERPVPRISIDAFCEFPDTLGTLEHAAADRRLSKAHVNIQSGGVHAAVKFFVDHPTPNLIIVETRGQGDDVIAELEQLATVCDETTKVIVIGRMNDVQLYRELTRRGVSEYLVAPLSTLHIIETIANLYVTAKAPPIGRVVVFAGARGGVGASTLAHNVGWCIAEGLKIDTAIIDFDLAFGTVGLNFTRTPGRAWPTRWPLPNVWTTCCSIAS